MERKQLDRSPLIRRKMQEKAPTVSLLPAQTPPVGSAETKTKASDYKSL